MLEDIAGLVVGGLPSCKGVVNTVGVTRKSEKNSARVKCNPGFLLAAGLLLGFDVEVCCLIVKIVGEVEVETVVDSDKPRRK